ncbi:peptidase M50B family [Clostridium sp. CAG:448]|nr:peptidase M50B family [Clostridium sp. CAG:448]
MELIALLLALGSHECAHWVAAHLCNIPVRGLFPGAGGLRLQLHTIPSYRQEWMICAVGPAFNFLTALVFLPLSPHSAFCTLLVRYALHMGTCNLLPIAGFDGGRMLHCTIASLCGLRAADITATVLSSVCLLLLWFVSVYIVLRTASALSAMLFSFLLFVHIFVGDAQKEYGGNRRKRENVGDFRQIS